MIDTSSTMTLRRPLLADWPKHSTILLVSETTSLTETFAGCFTFILIEIKESKHRNLTHRIPSILWQGIKTGVVILLGLLLLRKKKNPSKIMRAVLCSDWHFLLTNHLPLL